MTDILRGRGDEQTDHTEGRPSVDREKTAVDKPEREVSG